MQSIFTTTLVANILVLVNILCIVKGAHGMAEGAYSLASDDCFPSHHTALFPHVSHRTTTALVDCPLLRRHVIADPQIPEVRIDDDVSSLATRGRHLGQQAQARVQGE